MQIEYSFNFFLVNIQEQATTLHVKNIYAEIEKNGGKKAKN